MLKVLKNKNINYYLLTGILLTLSLIIVSLFGDFLAPYHESDAITIMKNPDTGKNISAPFEPSFAHPLGTDERGIDLVSKLFRGAKYTLIVVLVVSFSRILIGLPIGLIAGYYSKYLKKPLSYINRAWSSMPLFIFVYIIISPIVSPIVKYSFGMKYQFFSLWLILTLAGLPPLIETIRAHVENIKGYEFMEGVKVLGAGPFYTLYKHIFPHIKPYLVIIFSIEMAQILWLLGQLGVFNIFVGGTIEVRDYELGVTHYYSVTNEWAGLLGNGRKYFHTAPWITFAPALAFVYGILSFQFLAEGLRRRMNKHTANYYLGK